MFRSQITRALTLATIISMMMSSVALADVITNNVVESTASDTVTIVAGGSTTVTYEVQVQGAGADGQGGCNASDGSPLTLTISAPSGVTVTPATPLSFTQCATAGQKTATFSSATAGTYAITHSFQDRGSGTYTNAANFTLKVNAAPPSDTTAPSITPDIAGTVGNNGWYTSDVTVSFEVSDPDSAVSSKTAHCDAANSVTADTTGVTFTCTAASAGGSATSSVTIKRDATAPVISGTNINNTTWRNTDLTHGFTASDAMSGIGAADQSFTLTASAESANGSTPTTVSRTVTDAAGNSATRTVSALIDKTAPEVNPASVVNSTWRNIDLSQAFTASDSLSGLAVPADASFTLTASTQSADATTPTISSKTVTDLAGNSTTRSVSALIDLVAPVVTDAGFVSGTVGANGWYTSAVVNRFVASDALSGLASGVVSPFTRSSGTAEGPAVKVSSGSVADAAGNTTSGVESVAYKIDLSDPEITFDTRTAANAGWNNSDVTVTWKCSDAGSGVLATTVSVTVSTEGVEQTATGTCTDEAGRTASDTVSGINIDKTAPTVAYTSADGTAGNNGWYTSDVTATFTATDNLSGFAGQATKTGTATTTGEGSAITVGSPAFTDLAGNTASAGTATSDPYQIDKTAPAIPQEDVVSSGWRNEPLAQLFTATDAVSGLAIGTDASFTLTASAESTKAGAEFLPTVVSYDVYDVAGNKTTRRVSAFIDLTMPELTDQGPTAQATGTNGWYTSAVTNRFAASDSLSGLASDVTSPFTQSSGTNEGSAVKVSSGSVADVAGNSNPGIDSAAFMIDLSNPTNVAFVGGPAAGSSHYFGSVPAAPTCTAQDAISGLKDCVVTGYGTSVGTHTLTATATDNAGRTATATRTYTVLAWTPTGYYSPVDMSTATTTVWNTIKGGQTVPLKFELFVGSTEVTSVDAIASFQTQLVSCSTGVAGTEDAIEIVSTGGTSLRYDSTGGQFIQNWKTPLTSNKCYTATVTFDDGSKITAYFKTK